MKQRFNVGKKLASWVKLQPNGKSIFDIRDQYRRLVIMIISKQVAETKRLIAEGAITNEEQYKAHRKEQNQVLDKLYDTAQAMVFKLYRGDFTLA
jgi:hypothetical protein